MARIKELERENAHLKRLCVGVRLRHDVLFEPRLALRELDILRCLKKGINNVQKMNHLDIKKNNELL